MVKDQLRQQPTAWRILSSQLNNHRLSHAYLFSGPAGTGKRATAQAFALAINCPHRTAACDCLACRLDLEQLHPDVQTITADGNNIKQQQVRSMIGQSTLTPNQGKYRVFIVLEAERLTREAANALLLTLEEPSPSAVFILTATSPVLPTILSRCQVVQFHQKDGQLAGGSAGRADALARLEQIMQTAPSARLRFAEEIGTADYDLRLFLATLLDVMRDLFALTVIGSDSLVADRAAAERIRGYFSADAAELASRCQLLIDAERMLGANVNRRMLCEHLLLSL